MAVTTNSAPLGAINTSTPTILGTDSKQDIPQLTRRSLLKSAPLAAVAIAAPAIASVKTADRSAWDAAMAAHERAKAEDAAFDPIYQRIHAAWKAGKPSMDTIDWKEFPFADRRHVARVLDLEKAWQHFLEGEGKHWCSHDPAATKARRRAALDSVQAFRDAEERHDRDSGMDAAEERWDTLGGAVLDTQGKLMAMPAPDMAALKWKLDLLFEDDGTDSITAWAVSFVQQTKADYRRLLGEG